jgi:hypothetical protein
VEGFGAGAKGRGVVALEVALGPVEDGDGGERGGGFGGFRHG